MCQLPQGVSLGIWAGDFLKADYLYTSLGYTKMTPVPIMRDNPQKTNSNPLYLYVMLRVLYKHSRLAGIAHG